MNHEPLTPPTGTPAPPQIRSWRLIATMAGVGALAGLLIVVVFQMTLPAVEANRAARRDAAIHEVLKGIEHYETLYLVNGALTKTPAPGTDVRKLEKVYEGFDGSGQRVGFAIPTSEPGFQDSIDILFGFDPSKAATMGLVILASRETPGLGDKIERPEWRNQFADARTPLVGVKAGASEKPEDVDMITGATISSRTVIGAVNKAVERWAPLLDAYRAGGKP